MKSATVFSLLIGLMVFSHCKGQVKESHSIVPGAANATSYDYSLKMAHPAAQRLMKENFYWSTIEEAGPFGSDDGWEAVQGFREWRRLYISDSPITYLKELIADWKYPYFDWWEMDTTKIKAYIVSRANIDDISIQVQMDQFRAIAKNSPDTSVGNISDADLRALILSSSREVAGIYLLGQDNAIIGTAFAQFVLEGKVDRELKALTIVAIKRQLLPVLLNRYDDPYRETRKAQLTKMLAVVNQVP